MIEKLTHDERAKLHRYLQDRFNLVELKDLAFVLGVDYESLPHSTTVELSRELIGYFERRNNVSCLLQRVIALRADDELVGILARFGPCEPRIKVQIFLRGVEVDLTPDLVKELAKQAGTDSDEVEIIKAVRGTLHVLISLPEKAANHLTQRASDLQESILVTSFKLLKDLSQITWRTVAVYLPMSKAELLRVSLRWSDLTSLIKHSRLSLEKAKKSPEEKAAYHYYAGIILLNLRRGAEAVQSFNEALVLEPAFALAYLHRGVAYEVVGRYEQALKDYDNAVKSDRTLAEAYLARGAIYVRNGQLRRALSDFEHATVLDPKSAVSHLNSAGVLYRLKQYEEALVDFNLALQLDVTDKRIYFGRALTLAKLRRNNEAIKDLTKAIELDPEVARAYIDRGILYQRIGLYEEALADFNRAIQLGDPRGEGLAEEVREKTSDHYSRASREFRRRVHHSNEMELEITAGYEQETEEAASEPFVINKPAPSN